MAKEIQQKSDKNRYFYFNHLWTLIALIVLLCIAGACVESKMSLKKAKQVTINMSGKSFVPPPRQVDDILAILDEPAPEKAELVKKLKTRAAAEPPANASKKKLMKFYNKRGKAAANLGRHNQFLEDAREAYKLMLETDSYHWDVERMAGLIEGYYGNVHRSIEIMENHTKRKDPNGLAFWWLIKMYNQVGDLKSAERIRRQGLKRMSRKDDPGIWYNEACIEYQYLAGLGKHKEAEPFVRKALKYAKSFSHDVPRLPIYEMMRLSDTLMEQHRFIEAELEMRKLIKQSLALGGEASSLVSEGLELLSDLLLKQGRIKDSEKLIRKSIQILQEIGTSEDSWALGLPSVKLGVTLAADGRFKDAIDQFDSVRDSMKTNQLFFTNRFSRNPHLILSHLMTGQSDEALSLSDQAYRMLHQKMGESGYHTAEMLALRAMAYEATDKYAEALDDFVKALPVLRAGEFMRRDFLARQRFKYILESHISLLHNIQGKPLEKIRGIHAAEEAFKLVEILNEGTVKKALGAGSARAAASYDPELSDLVGKEQDAQEQIKVLEKTLVGVLSLSSDQQDSKTITDLRNYIKTLRKARTALLTEIKARFPKFADFLDPPPVSFAMLQQKMNQSEAIVSIYPARQRTYIWAVPKEGAVAFSAATMGKADIQRNVALLRKALAPDPSTFGGIPDFDVTLAHKLYEALLKPVESGWTDANDLSVIASGPIGQIPLYILPTETVALKNESMLFSKYRKVPWLIRKVSVTRIPSAASLAALRELPQVGHVRKAFLGFGDPVFHPDQMKTKPDEKQEKKSDVISRGVKLRLRAIRGSDQGNLDSKDISSSQLSRLSRLPDTAEEIIGISKTLEADPKQDVFLGKRASEKQVKSMNLSDRRVIAFATHALVPGDLDGLMQPAIALSSPLITQENEDGLLTMDEILRLRVNTDWVILSACNTGAAEGAGAEAVSGLGKAFFYAGSRALLVSMWPVETTSAKALTTGVFRFQKADQSLTRSQSLRKAVLDLMDNQLLKDTTTQRVIASYAHPLFWAPFIVVGDGGR